MGDLVKTDRQELLTQAEIAERIGKSIATVSRLISEIGLEPVIPAQSTQAGIMPARYDFGILQKAQNDLQNAKDRERHTLALEKEIEKTSLEAKNLVIRQSIESLQKNHSSEAVQAKLANAVGFMQMLVEELDFQQKEASRVPILEDRVNYLEKELDIASDKMTVETYAIKKGHTVTRQVASSITRQLHKAGYKDLGKIPSKYDNNMPATVWDINALDYAYNQYWFK